MKYKDAFNLAKQNNVDAERTRILMKYILKDEFNKYSVDTELKKEQENFLKNSIEELKNGKPIQYITHEQYFYGNKFYVDENVLIPQPDTEIIVEETLKQIKNLKKQNVKILDLCTGSGAISISILNSFDKYIGDNSSKLNVSDFNKHIDDFTLESNASNFNKHIDDFTLESNMKLFNKNKSKTYSKLKEIKENNLLPNKKNIEMYASDISKNALKVAYKNEENILKKHMIKFVQSDMFENIKEKFDIIVSNPPYIKSDVIKTLQKDVQNEPHIALDGGKDGLKFYKIISDNYKKYLEKDGIILLEIGFDQRNDVQTLFKGSTCIKDFAGNDRVIIYKE